MENFESKVMDKLEQLGINQAVHGKQISHIETTLDEHNAQTADIAKDVKDLQKHKYLIYGAIGVISFIGTIAAIISNLM